MPFDPNAHESKSFDVLPAGDYTAILEGAELKETKKNNGHFLSLTFQIVSDQGKGRKIWTNLNLDNPNTTAVAIAEAELADICRAAGVTALDDWVGFIPKNPGCAMYDVQGVSNIPIVLRLKKVFNDFKGEDDNEIKAYLPAGAAPATAQATQGFGNTVEDKSDLPF